MTLGHVEGATTTPAQIYPSMVGGRVQIIFKGCCISHVTLSDVISVRLAATAADVI